MMESPTTLDEDVTGTSAAVPLPLLDVIEAKSGAFRRGSLLRGSAGFCADDKVLK